MVATFSLKDTLSLGFLAVGILCMGFAFIFGYMNRETKRITASALAEAAEAARKATEMSPQQITTMTESDLGLPSADDIKSLIETLPEEDRAVGAFIVAGLGCLALALVPAGVITLNTAPS